MTTFQELINDTRDYLMTGQPDKINILHATIDSSVTSLQLSHELKGIDAGARLAIDLEEMHVISRSGTTPESTVTVIRGFNGSAAAAHTAGALVRVSPQFSDWRIARRINKCLETLVGEGLFRIQSVEFSFNPAQAGYNINAPDLIDIWRVRADNPGPSNNWPVLNARDYYLDQAADSVEFPNSKQFVLRIPGFPGHKVRISYRTGFSATLSSPSQDVEVITGLHASAHDIPALGAAYRLLAGRDIKRSFLNRQPEPRRQDEVPSGAATNAMLPIVQEYYRAINREISLLDRRYPRQL
jgi:hypothetical protein